MNQVEGVSSRGELNIDADRGSLDPAPVPVRIRLSSLWVSVMFCFIYADYFELYVPGKLRDMLDGRMALGDVSQSVLVGTSTLMLVPSLMIVLSLSLPPSASRALNIVVGIVYAAIMLLIVSGGPWAYYVLFATVEILLLCAVVWNAWRWPRTPERT
jgi:hypothetical protein